MQGIQQAEHSQSAGVSTPAKSHNAHTLVEAFGSRLPAGLSAGSSPASPVPLVIGMGSYFSSIVGESVVDGWTIVSSYGCCCGKHK